MNLPIYQPDRAPKKPREGEPCSGCGYCCSEEVCRIGKKFFGRVAAPCPGLTFHDGRHWCSLVEMGDHLEGGPLLRLTFGIGMGCDSSDPEEVTA